MPCNLIVRVTLRGFIFLAVAVFCLPAKVDMTLSISEVINVYDRPWIVVDLVCQNATAVVDNALTGS